MTTKRTKTKTKARRDPWSWSSIYDRMTKKDFEDAFEEASEEVERWQGLFVMALRHIRNLGAGITEPTEASKELEPWLKYKRTREQLLNDVNEEKRMIADAKGFRRPS